MKRQIGKDREKELWQQSAADEAEAYIKRMIAADRPRDSGLRMEQVKRIEEFLERAFPEEGEDVPAREIGLVDDVRRLLRPDLPLGELLAGGETDAEVMQILQLREVLLRSSSAGGADSGNAGLQS